MQLRQAMVADKLTAGELMCTSLVALPPVVPLRQLTATLRGCRHTSFPVTEDPAAALQPGQVPQSPASAIEDALVDLDTCLWTNQVCVSFRGS